MPDSIISDKDRIFASNFWQELFRKSGTKLLLSTAYYPQTDGQTEVLNRCLENYLRCMTGETPAHWYQWLPLVEWWYNSSYHSSIQLTPYEALYSQPPPAHMPYLAGVSPVAVVDRSLWAREAARKLLHFYLKKAQHRMKHFADKHRSERSFQVGDLVYLRLQPYQRQSLQKVFNQKLSPKYYGPFPVIQKAGTVAYTLQLPQNSRIHPTFHVSQLKKHVGSVPTQLQLPLVDAHGALPKELVRIIDRRIVKKGSQAVTESCFLSYSFKIFVPITVVALLILIPVNVSSGTLFFLRKELEYDNVATMRLRFLASQRRRAEQFTVLVRNVPQISVNSISDSLDQFFKTSHPDTYLCYQRLYNSCHYFCTQAVYNAYKFAKLVRKRDRLQNWLDYNQLKFEIHSEKRPTKKTGFLGLWGKRVDSIDFYKQQIKEFDKNMALERQKVLKDTKSILPVAFVSFKSRWGAAVCAQTQQSKNPTLWLANWAPEPRDIYWQNLAIPFLSLTIRKLIISLSVFALVFFYMIPIAFVQSLANLEGLERVAPFLRPFIKSFLQGFLPGLALKISLYILPTVLMIMSKIEGHIALSILERRASAKYYYFMLVNVFLGSIVTGTAFEQLHSFLHQSPTQIPRTIGVSIPMKATFFITFIMVDGWAGIAGEILRLKPLVIFHLKNMFLLKTESDREQAMDPGSVDSPETLRITIINVYNQQYESGAAFWPHVHSRIIASLVISQLLFLGLLSTKEAANSTPLLAILPILTLSFNQYCKHRFEPAFRRYHSSQTSDDHSSPSPTHHPTTSPPQDVYHHGFPPQYAYSFSSPTHYGYHYEAEPGNSRD
ncbi:hypothetical protein ES332_D08G195100v1 [Gossypium tomentosum]|uniref:Integrase catalytic domain-containing protein n=1 Tax=Gossypium tomentosum TaxID=34277 RepID=A0A5D2JZ84_GOSTO|nr:hypothetical protein ES332_D08G195100v1 [Gossypium tomentosum]